MNQSAGLFRLQTLDIKIAQFNAKIYQLNATISDDSELQQSHQSLENVKNSLHLKEQNLKEASFQTSSLRVKVEQSESSLYSGTIKNPKELQDLQSEIKSLKKQIEVAEEKELGLMLEVDTLQTENSDQEKTYSGALAKRESQINSLKIELSSLKKEMDKILVERDAAEKSLHKEDLDIYNRVKQHKSGIAVVEVIDNTCSSCGAEISQAEWQRARISSELIYCQGCNRIIYAKS